MTAQAVVRQQNHADSAATFRCAIWHALSSVDEDSEASPPMISMLGKLATAEQLHEGLLEAWLVGNQGVAARSVPAVCGSCARPTDPEGFRR